jgi:hypothetical protein
MTKTPFLLALSLALVAAPAAVAHPDAPGHHGGDRAGTPPPAKDGATKAKDRSKGPKGTLHLTQACVVSAATATGVEVGPLSVNRHMRDALAGATTLTAAIGDATVVRLVGRARHLPEGITPTRAPKVGSFADLAVGDRVTVRIRAPRGTAAADLPAAFRIVDHGPSKRCAAPVTPPPGEDPTDPVDPGPAL